MSEQELTWSQWLESNKISDDLVQIPEELGQRPWNPSEKDREAAWILYTEIRTRISTQPLHYRSGDEETALESIHSLFALTRKIIEEKGPQCRHFATIAIHVLNNHVRPLTARWHKKKIAGHLENDDDRREFRKELGELQARLIEFCRLLGSIAEGDEYLDGDSCNSDPEKDDTAALDALGPEIPFDQILFDDKPTVYQELYDEELKAIRERRNEQEQINNLAALACSGGGIRSATFCLGVAQSLARRGVLPRIDYLSTVSGGSYLGSFLSSYLNDSDTKKVGLEPGKLPFAEADRAEPEPIRQLRNNSKYLLKGGLLGQARMAGLLLFGILVNLLTLLPVLFGALTLTKIAQLMGVTGDGFNTFICYAMTTLSILLAAMLLGLPFVYRRGALKRKWITGYERGSILIAFALIGVWALGWLLPSIYGSLASLFGSPGAVLWFIGSLPFLFAVIAFIMQATRIAVRGFIVLAGIAGPLLLLMSFLVLNNAIGFSWQEILGLLAISIALIAWLRLINVNQISPHRFYRNRLAETYLLRRGEESAIDPQPLSDLQSDNSRSPYHLINATVNLPSSKEPGLRGRDSDFFLFSRNFCGSPLLGYCKTRELERKDRILDLGTATAISGAAASNYMGSKTIKGLAFWLSLFNIRLGYWLPNPKRLTEMPDGPGAKPFSLWKELFGRIDENAKFVNLSDGGHIENLGIYELLRRRCKFIVAIDAEADPGMSFPSLMKLIRYARIDFGIDISLELDDLKLNKAGFTKAHFALGEIDYGGGDTGYLLYIKASLTGNEQNYILDYRQNHPDFPHETTADQFFSEVQFEAYRALGDHIGDDLFHDELIKGAGEISLESWFRALVRNLRG